MSNAYNHCYNAMRTAIIGNGNPNVVAEIIYMALYCEEQYDGTYEESYFGNPYDLRRKEI